MLRKGRVSDTGSQAEQVEFFPKGRIFPSCIFNLMTYIISRGAGKFLIKIHIIF